MDNKNLAIGIGILLLVGFGLLFMSTMTGNVITGSVAVEKVDVDEPFRINDFGAEKDEVPVEDEVKDGA
jgi:hypothetical protein